MERGDDPDITWPDPDALRDQADALVSACDSVVAALTVTQGFEDMRRVSELQQGVVASLDAALSRPTHTDLLDRLLAWLDTRDPTESYEDDDVARRLGREAGMAAFGDPDERRTLFSGGRAAAYQPGKRAS